MDLSEQLCLSFGCQHAPWTSSTKAMWLVVFEIPIFWHQDPPPKAGSMHPCDRLTVQQRKQIGELYKKGHSITSLSKRFSISRATVRRWIAEAGKPNPVWSDAPGRGRPLVLNSSERRKARRSARYGSNVTHVAASINKQRQQPASRSTVRRSLVTGSKPLYWGLKRRGRRLSAKNKAARLTFAMDNLHAQTRSWLFVDSKHFFFYKSGNRVVQWGWQQDGQKVVLPSSSNPTHMHVYSCVGLGFKGKLQFTEPSPPLGSKQKHSDKNFTSHDFIQVAKRMKTELEVVSKADARHPIILDHATQHTSATSKLAMKQLGLHVKKGFPAQGWDINIIENVWGVLETKLQGFRGRLPTTSNGWRRRLNAAWDEIQQTTIDKLVLDVRSRLEGIVQADGAWLFDYNS